MSVTSSRPTPAIVDRIVAWLETGALDESSSNAGVVDGLRFYQVTSELFRWTQSVVADPSGSASGAAIEPLVRLLDWAARSHGNERIHPRSRPSPARIADLERQGANLAGIAAFDVGSRALTALFTLPPAETTRWPSVTTRTDVVDALAGIAESWSDEDVSLFARIVDHTQGPGGLLKENRKAIASLTDADPRRRLLARLLASPQRGPGRTLLAKVARARLAMRVELPKLRLPRAAPTTLEAAFALVEALGMTPGLVGLRAPRARTAGEQTTAIGRPLPPDLLALYDLSDGVGERLVATSDELPDLQANYREWLGVHQKLETEEPLDPEERAEIRSSGLFDLRSLGDPEDFLALGKSFEGDVYLVHAPRDGSPPADARVLRYEHEYAFLCAPFRASIGALISCHVLETVARTEVDDRALRLVASHEKQLRSGAKRPRR